jgi:hypothetical protein
MSNFTNNYFYDLPEEVQELIYKKQWVSVMQELKECANMKAKTLRVPCWFHKKFVYMHTETLKSYKNVFAGVMFADAMRKLVVVDLMAKVRSEGDEFNKYKGDDYLYTYGGCSLKSVVRELQHENKVYCPCAALGIRFALRWHPDTTMPSRLAKNYVLEFLQANNQITRKSWNKTKLLKALMAF